MRFVRNRSTNTTENTKKYVREAKKKYSPADFKVFFKRYLQTYLRWLYEQNPYFADNLTTDEICNYLLHRFIQPAWLQLYIQKKPERILVEIADYVKKYAHNAEQMEIETIVYPQDSYVKKVEFPELQQHSLTSDELNQIRKLSLQSTGVTMPEEDFLLLSALTKKRKENKI